MFIFCHFVVDFFQQSNQWFYLLSGYFVAIVSCLWPGLVKSVILVNSAGDVVPKDNFLPIAKVSLFDIIFLRL